ncbi:MAG: hypothetical protein KGJ23_08425 [Euryarchaeota archaeon]|nr:hypothetical protein [Euryarchaeota archaeon]MDE1836627.1 hypothetical protein [Euryarchaeota archaeon]MDE1879178.1 hypothetical protein [Euryarchaeota archaeon]MDE2044597.1 hypothetical protein [Thermoplasmata archaeon]
MTGLVLDSTCSQKRAWPERADVRVDVAKGARPDVLADDTRLPFKEGAFSEVYCDPPHLVGRGKKWVSDLSYIPDYGRFSRWGTFAEWFQFLEKVNGEFGRVLEPGGLLHFKVPDGSRSHGRMVDRGDLEVLLTGFTVVEDKRVQSDGHLARINKKRGKGPSFVHYVTLKRKG